MKTSSFGYMQSDEADFNFKEWALKAQISRENPICRTSSYIRSFREDRRSFRSNITISSGTASSPGYPFRDEIDPSTYSFTSALKALQARSGYTNWECLSPEGFALNSKWNEAEKYICNPLSGEFPVECLSARTLSGRSFHKLTNRITVSAPLVYSSRNIQVKPSIFEQDDMDFASSTVSEKKTWGTTRDVGIQSTPPYLISSSQSPSSSPSITDHSTKQCWDSPNSNSNIKSLQQVEGKKTREAAGDEIKRVQAEQLFRQGGCLSFSWVRSKRQRKIKTQTKNHIFSHHFKGC